MCAIMGLVGRQPSEDFDRAFSTLKHRGPDATGRWSAPFSENWTVQLGHHRLAIIDVDSGHQPLTKGKTTIVFNGEIYNFRELGQDLQVEWKTRSDTEVLLELFRREGVEAFNKLDGFFAAAFIDEQAGSITLARDPYAIKPLYYAPLSDGGLMFASELSPFLYTSHFKPQLCREATEQFLFWEHVPFELTTIEGVFKLLPGHFLVWKNGLLSVKKYHHIENLIQQKRSPISSSDLWNQLKQSVERALISDVPVGILLSGGIDSSLLALAATELRGSGLPTFALGFKDKNFDESQYARQVAKAIGSTHYEKIVSEDELFDRWRDIVLSLDEPLADPSILPTRLLFELASDQVKVVLGGDGGDELFAGYPTYFAQQLHPLLAAIPKTIFEPLRSMVLRHLKLSDTYQPLSWKLKRLVGRFDRDPVRCHWRWMSVTDSPTVSHLTQRPFDPFRGIDREQLDPDDLQTFLLMDLRYYLGYSVLTKVDRASMAVGLESRPPFLSQPLVRQAFQIPSEQKLDGSEGKVILRDLVRSKLGSQIADRPKRGFAIPLSRWLKGPMRPEMQALLKDNALFDAHIINAEATRNLWQEFISGSGDHARTFWSLLVLTQWLKRLS